MPLYLPLSSYAASNGALLNVPPIVHYPPESPTVPQYFIEPPGGPGRVTPPVSAFMNLPRVPGRRVVSPVGPVAL